MTGSIIIVTVGMNIIARMVIITINIIINTIKKHKHHKHYKWHDGYDDDDWDDDDD